MKSFFLSLKTTVWTLTAIVVLFFIGSYMMPVHGEVFGPMNSGLLVDWAVEIGISDLWHTWWLFASVAALVLLTINTVVCSIQAVKGKWSRRDALLRLSPQVIHLGFLFVLLGHLLGAGWGYRLAGMLPEGASAGLPDSRTLQLSEIRADFDQQGALRNWSAVASVYRDNVLLKSGTLGPNQPLFHEGTGIYLMRPDFRGGPAAFLMANKDPGALWALVGGILTLAGSMMLLVLKWKKT
jgi:cytochrome c biogenesis protein ResB